MKMSERLQKRLADELDIHVELPIRIRRGRHGKSAGTWAWMALRKTGYGAGGIGSEDTMTECVTCSSLGYYRSLSTGEIHVCAEDERDEFREGDVCLEISTFRGSIGATHFYGKLCPWDDKIRGQVSLMDTLTAEQAEFLNRKHGCEPGEIGSYEEGQEYNGWDDMKSLKEEAIRRYREFFPDAERLVIGRAVRVEHDGVLDER